MQNRFFWAFSLCTFFFATAFSAAPKTEKACGSPADDSKSIDEFMKGELRAYEVSTNRPDSPDRFYQNLTKEYQISTGSGPHNISIKARRLEALTQPKAGTVVYLCGGPATCVDRDHQNVPLNFEIVTFDYLGLGENTLGPAQPELLSLESQATAVQKIVEAFHLDRYIIYGQSFGTVVATMAASQIGKSKSTPQPQSVILEGVSTARRLWNLNGYQTTADRTWSLLTTQEKAEFQKKLAETKKKLAPRDAPYLEVILTQKLWHGPVQTAQALKDWMSLALKERLKQVHEMVPELKKPELRYDAYTRMYNASACQAMPGKIRKKPMRFFNNLIRSPYGNRDFCECRTIARNYDPKNFQIRAPILYINGEYDPATPMSMANYHYQSQKTSAAKTLVSVKDGGHFSTIYELASCIDLIYEHGQIARVIVKNQQYRSTSRIAQRL
jgi:pimeloyl-ACP methyl ester carboxylesterase